MSLIRGSSTPSRITTGPPTSGRSPGSYLREENTSCSVSARRSQPTGADREELRGRRSNQPSLRSSALTTFGHVVRHAIPQQWWESLPDIGNKILRLDHFLLSW